MPVDRPRRALLEEPDDVESYVAKRSRGFTQADSGDRVVVRPARAARALEPSAIGTQLQIADHDHLGLSGSPPRRALPPESLRWHDLDEEVPAPTDTKTTGRRAIVDPEPTQSSEPDLPSRLAKLLAEPDVELETPRPRRSVSLPPIELVTELPKITSELRPADPTPPVPVQPPKPTLARAPAVAQAEPAQPYRPAAPIDRPTAPLPPTPAMDRPSSALRQAQGAAQITEAAAQTTQRAGQINPGAAQSATAPDRSLRPCHRRLGRRVRAQRRSRPHGQIWRPNKRLRACRSMTAQGGHSERRTGNSSARQTTQSADRSPRAQQRSHDLCRSGQRRGLRLRTVQRPPSDRDRHRLLAVRRHLPWLGQSHHGRPCTTRCRRSSLID